ncbi:hypothetical protein ABZP36_009104 [Zizania latifolia]
MGRLLWLSLVVALLAPVHGRVGIAADQRPALVQSFHVEEPKQQNGVRGGSKSWWSSSTSRSPPGRGAGAGAELRSVPAGPDPMHHHSSPRRPEPELIP